MHKNLFFFIFSILAFSAHAVQPSIYFWDNQEKFIEGQNCKIVPENQSPFRIAQGSVNGEAEEFASLLGPTGNKQSSLPDFSIVKLHKIRGTSVPGSTLIQILGLNASGAIVRGISKRGDNGYIYDGNLQGLEKFTFQPSGVDTSLFTSGTNKNLRDTSWQLVSDSNLYTLDCRNMSNSRKYLLFEVTPSENLNAPIAFIGVSEQETNIFHQISSVKAASFNSKSVSINDNQELVDALRETHSRTDNTNNITEEDLIADIDLPQAGETPNQVVDNTLMVCTADRNGLVNIRDNSLSRVKFKAALGEVVTKFQNWNGDNTRTTVIGGRTWTFIKVKFVEREEDDQKTGWIAKDFAKKASNCFAYTRYNMGSDTTDDNDPSRITSITDKDCCEFPMVNPPRNDYTKGAGRFEANRNIRDRRTGRIIGTRKHAGCDMYRRLDEPVVSIAPGKVISNLYYFYQDTYAVEIEHVGGVVARYGEIANKRAPGIRPGLQVTKGQRVGNIGNLTSGCCAPMIHFELYSGELEGSLTDKNEPIYRRRRDLIDPTQFLLRWQEMKF